MIIVINKYIYLWYLPLLCLIPFSMLDMTHNGMRRISFDFFLISLSAMIFPPFSCRISSLPLPMIVIIRSHSQGRNRNFFLKGQGHVSWFFSPLWNAFSSWKIPKTNWSGFKKWKQKIKNKNKSKQTNKQTNIQTNKQTKPLLIF